MHLCFLGYVFICNSCNVDTSRIFFFMEFVAFNTGSCTCFSEYDILLAGNRKCTTRHRHYLLRYDMFAETCKGGRVGIWAPVGWEK